jgi:hypothetical protein
LPQLAIGTALKDVSGPAASIDFKTVLGAALVVVGSLAYAVDRYYALKHSSLDKLNGPSS